MLIKINKKIYLIFLIILFVLVYYFLLEVKNFNIKSNIYARQNLFHPKVDFDKTKFYLLDGYSESLDFKTIPYCELIKYYPIKKFKKMAYRYPTSINIAKYWLIAHKKNEMIGDAERVNIAYALLSKSGKYNFKTKFCY